MTTLTIDFGARSKGGVLMESVFNISEQINAVPSVRLSYASGWDISAIPPPQCFCVFDCEHLVLKRK